MCLSSTEVVVDDVKTVFTSEIDDHDCHNTELFFCKLTGRMFD